MHYWIQEMIKRHGGRLAGSVAEKNAQFDMKQQLDEFCSETDWHAFKYPLDAKFGALKFLVPIFVISLILWFFNPWIAIGLSILNGVLFFGHFVTYQDWLGFLWPEKESVNVSGVLNPQKEVKFTVVLSGHMDNVREFHWWYKLGTLGAQLTLFSGLLLTFHGPIMAFFTGFFPDIASIVNWIFIALSPITLTMFWMHGNIVVDGAQDNLSGLCSALRTLQAFKDPSNLGQSNLQHVRLQMLSLGSEECGTIGAKMFAKHKTQSWDKEKTLVINMDGIMNPDLFTIVAKEVNPWVTYPVQWRNHLKASFKNQNIPCKEASLFMGATDGHRFAKAGFNALSVLALPTDSLDPSYHTRLDTFECIHPEAIPKMVAVLKDFISNMDKELSK